MKISINPRLAEQSFDWFKKWMKAHFPGEDAAQWYKKLGGKPPKDVSHKKHDNNRAAGKAD